ESRCRRSRYKSHVEVLRPSFARIVGWVASREAFWRLRLLRPQPSVQYESLIFPLFPLFQNPSHVTVLLLKRCCGGWCVLDIAVELSFEDGVVVVVVVVVVASTFKGVPQWSVRLLRSLSRQNISHLSKAHLPKWPSTGDLVILRTEYPPWESNRNSSTPHVLISKEPVEHGVSSTSKRMCRGRENQELYIYERGKVGKANKSRNVMRGKEMVCWGVVVQDPSHSGRSCPVVD
ncbi:hypothetical protein CTA2_10439, partial [Colletotrichum tanaceti]